MAPTSPLVEANNNNNNNNSALNSSSGSGASSAIAKRPLKTGSTSNRGFFPSTHVILLEDVAFVRRQTKRKSTNLTAMNISTLLSSGGTDGGGDNGSGTGGGSGGGSNSNNNSASNNNHNNSSSGSNGAMSHIDSNLAVMAKDPESMLGNRLGQILKKKKLEPLDFVEEKKEIDGATKPHIESSWWDSDLAIPFCKMSLDVMTDWSRHFSELMNEENVDLFERVFDLLCKIAFNVGCTRKHSRRTMVTR